MQALGGLLFRVGLATLPRWLRDRAGPEMLAAFEHAQREVRARHGPLALPLLWIRELAGLARAGFRARRPGSWARRTQHTVPSTGPRGHPPIMSTALADLHAALRAFARRPAVPILGVLTLSLGIGAATAMFSVVESVLLRPLPYPEPDRLVSVYPGWPSLRGHPTLGHLADRGTWAWPEFFGVREEQEVFETFAAYENASFTVQSEDGPAERIGGARATWDLFPLLGATPTVGRLFNEDDLSGAGVVILDHGFWNDRYGGDPAAVGRMIELSDQRYEIVGVLPPDFEVWGVESAQVWVPRTGSLTQGNLGNHSGTRAVARLADGVTLERAESELTRVFGEVLPPEHGEHEGSLFPRQEDETLTARPVLVVMMAASFLLLLVACGNVAAILLGAGIDRERELAVRGAIGADRGLLIRQLLVESLLLSTLSVAGGVVAAVGLSKLLLLVAPTGVPGLDGASLNTTVLVFAAGTATLFGVGFGLIPALSLSKVDLASAMGTSRTIGSPRARLQSLVVVGELALATVLLIGALLLARTVWALDSVELGYDAEQLIVTAPAMPFARFRDEEGNTDEAALRTYQTTLIEEIAALPGVAAVAETSTPPLTGWRNNNGVTPDGWDPSVDAPVAERRLVSADFFQTMGVEIVEGRPLTEDDFREDAPLVVVVSEGLADLGWPDESPVGRTLTWWQGDATVVGVAANIRDEELEEVTELAFYAPGTGGPLLIRAERDPQALLPAIRERVAAYDRSVPLLEHRSLPELMAAHVAEERYRARLMVVFAGIAGVLALLGIYGVTSRSVARRTREMGIRLALGSGRGRVRGLVTRQAVRLGTTGVLVGVVSALIAGGVLEAFLYGVEATDPVSLAAVGLGLPLAAALAALPPALRATRIDPREALRAE